MVSLWAAASRSRELAPTRHVTSVDDYISTLQQSSFTWAGTEYGLSNLTGTWTKSGIERIGNSLEDYARAAYHANGVVYACLAVRMAVFSAVRMSFQRYAASRPAELFGVPDLGIFERPWMGGTTQDLLAKMILDADLAGNSYWVRMGPELVRLRPDWVEVLLSPRMVPSGLGDPVQVGWERLAYCYYEGGKHCGNDPAMFAPSEVAHFAPKPDPLASWRGMSWISAVLPEIIGDKAMNTHKNAFLENAATPNLSVSLDKDISREAFQTFATAMDDSHKGASNAYKTLYLGGGADVRVVGQNLQQMDFKNVQGHGETRIAAAAEVPPVIVGLSEGLASATYSNYGLARRRFADGTLHPLWANAAGSLATLLPPPAGTRLWYDSRDVPFLREDQKDAAEIQGRKATTMRALIEAGFEPEAVVRAVTSEDLDLLRGAHTGLTSVQLQPPFDPNAVDDDKGKREPADPDAPKKELIDGDGDGIAPE